MADKTKVRTTIRREDVIEVDDRELADLKALGLLFEVDGKRVPAKEQAAVVAAKEEG